jgi:hypothetical protein
VAVTGRDGWAEAEVPMGRVVASVGRRLVQEDWVGADQVVEFHFLARRQDVEQVGADFLRKHRG